MSSSASLHPDTSTTAATATATAITATSAASTLPAATPLNEPNRIWGVYCTGMRSSWSLGVVFIVLGGLSVSGIGGHRPLGPAPWVLAGLLVAAGALLFTRTRVAFYVALAT